MSRQDEIGQREELRIRRRSIEAEVSNTRDAIRDVLPLTADAADINSEYVVRLAIKLNERVQELRGVNKKIAILEREFGEWHGLGA